MHAIVLGCALALAAVLVIQNSFIPLAPFLFDREHVGTLLSVQGVASAAVLPVLGAIVDRTGARKVLETGLALQTAVLVLACGPSLFALELMIRALQGGASTTVFNAAMAFIMERHAEPERSAHIGTALGIGMLGNVVGQPLAGYIFYAVRGSVADAKAFAYLPGALLLAYSWSVLRVVPRTEPEVEERLLPPTEPSGTPKEAVGFARRYFGVYVVGGCKVWLLAFSLVCVFFAMQAVQCAGVLELHAAGFSAAQIGFMSVPAGLMQVVVAPWAARKAAGGKQGEFVVAGLLVLGGGQFLVGLVQLFGGKTASSPWGQFAAVTVSLALSSAACSIADGPSISLMASYAAAEGCGYGEALTASETAVTIGVAMGPYAGSALFWDFGFGGLCLANVVFSAVVAMASASLPRSPPLLPEKCSPVGKDDKPAASCACEAVQAQQATPGA